LLAVRPRTRSELASALRRRGVSQEVATSVLDRYDEVGIIDDAAFARAWVTSRHHGQGLARRALGSELRRRGVESELVGAALVELDEQTERATARALVGRRARSTSGSPEVVFRRLVAVLARKGYPAGLAISVVKDVLGELGDERLVSFAELVDPDAMPELVGDGSEDAQ
jgi:regulatory protein